MDDIWIDAVSQFLKGDEWRRSVKGFVDTNCSAFAGSEEEHTHGQYDVWRQFRDLVDGQIEGVIAQLGGSPETFCKACDERLARDDRGPRDAAMKELLKQLLTFDDFANFHEMMREHSLELASGFDRTEGALAASPSSYSSPPVQPAAAASVPQPSLQPRTSEPVRAIAVVDRRRDEGGVPFAGRFGAGGETDLARALSLSLEEAKAQEAPEETYQHHQHQHQRRSIIDDFLHGANTAYPSSPSPAAAEDVRGGGGGGGISNGGGGGSGNDVPIYLDEHSSWGGGSGGGGGAADTWELHPGSSSSSSSSEEAALAAKAQEKEWEAQLVIAMSLLESGEAGQRVEPELLDWASAVIEMQNLLAVEARDSPVVERKNKELMVLRVKVDLVVARRITEENAAIRRDIERRREEAAAWEAQHGGQAAVAVLALSPGGSAYDSTEEQTLDEMLQRLAELQDEMDTVRKGCLEYTPRFVSETSWLEIYFFLDERMRSSSNGGSNGSGGGAGRGAGGGGGLEGLDAADDIHRFVFARISTEHMDLVPSMLRLIVLETEAEEVKKKVHAMMPQTPRGESARAAAIARAGGGALGDGSSSVLASFGLPPSAASQYRNRRTSFASNAAMAAAEAAAAAATSRLALERGGALGGL